MRAPIVALAAALVLSATAPAAAVTVSTPVAKTDVDAVQTLKTESSLPVRQMRRVVSPTVADFPSDHAHVMRTPPSRLLDFITTHENKGRAFVRIVLGKK